MMLIIDASNMAYRALYTMSLSHGDEDVSILYGTLKMLFALVTAHHPRYVVACFDGGTPPWRRELVPTYKAHRTKDDAIDWESVYSQIDNLCYQALPLHGVLSLRMKHAEADDLMAQAARMASDRPYIVTSDDDLLQCVDLAISVINPLKGKIITHDNFDKEVGVPPELYLLYKMLVGDSSDGVPGVAGIGPKTAVGLIKALDDHPNADPYDYQHVCKIGKSVLNKRQQASLVDLGIEDWYATYDTMSLEQDLCDTRPYIRGSEWSAMDEPRLKRWLMSKAFVSLMTPDYFGAYHRLERPPFDNLMRMPQVRMVDRCPC